MNVIPRKIHTEKNIASGTLYILTEILGVAHSFVHVIAISYACFVRWKVFSRKSCLGIVLHVSVFKRMQRSHNFLLFSPDISISPLTTWIVSFQVINFFLVHKNYDFFVLRTALKQKKNNKKQHKHRDRETEEEEIKRKHLLRYGHAISFFDDDKFIKHHFICITKWPLLLSSVNFRNFGFSQILARSY